MSNITKSMPTASSQPLMKPRTVSTLVKAPSMAREPSRLGLFDDEASRRDFCSSIWPRVEQHSQQTPLIRQYQRCCNVAYLSGEAVAEQRNSDVIDAVLAIRANKTPDEIMEVVTSQVHHGHQDDSCLTEDQNIAEHLITIAFNIAFMCNLEFRHVRSSMPNPGVRQLEWDSGSAKALLAEGFPKSNNLKALGRLPRTFHARNLERFGSFQVVWTANLLDHLRLHDPAEEGRPFTVTVFHYAQFLQSNEKSDMFPEGLIAETLRSLALLLPGHIGGTIGWFKKQQRYNKDLDMTACFCNFSDDENRTIQSFAYWRDRIAILKQTYDESEPRTVWQWWNDGRKRERWATFWVAMIVLFLTVFFGLIQCIEAALQVYKAYHPS